MVTDVATTIWMITVLCICAVMIYYIIRDDTWTL